MEEFIIVEVIKNENPFPIISIMQPVMKEFEYIRLRILPVGYFNSVGYLPATLLETSCITRMNPENPCFGRSISNSMTVFNGKLRFSFKLLAMENPPNILSSPDAT